MTNLDFLSALFQITIGLGLALSLLSPDILSSLSKIAFGFGLAISWRPYLADIPTRAGWIIIGCAIIVYLWSNWTGLPM